MARGTIQVKQALIANLPKHGRYLLGVSGGKDSMCLLHAAYELRKQCGYTLEVAHVNYNLRAESGSDMEFVREQASERGLPCHTLEVSEPAPDGENIENWARTIRYNFFKECIKANQLEVTLTAHTAHDLAETLLMRLISNKEPRGIMTRDTSRALLRPLLQVALSEILSYIQQNNIPYVQDHTNLETDLLRNRVRNVLIPHLEEHFDPRITDVLSLRAESLHEDFVALDCIIKKYVEIISEHEWGEVTWGECLNETLKSWQLDKSLSWRFISAVMAQKIGYLLGRAHSIRALDVFLGKSVACEIPNGWELRRKRGGAFTLTQDT